MSLVGVIARNITSLRRVKRIEGNTVRGRQAYLAERLITGVILNCNSLLLSRRRPLWHAEGGSTATLHLSMLEGLNSRALVPTSNTNRGRGIEARAYNQGQKPGSLHKGNWHLRSTENSYICSKK